VTIEGNEFFGFPVGLDIKLDSVGFPSSVSRNYAHDRYDNTRWGPPWQRGEAQLSFLAALIRDGSSEGLADVA
jgi:hypothetical protein